MPNSIRTLLAIVLLLPITQVTRAEKMKVFILAGQSNMEGKAKVSLLEYQATHGKTIERFAHLRSDGGWKERADVFIKFLDRKGKLTVGYGSPNCIGPELEFGNTVGDRLEEQVLLIKTAWGGKSLYRDFRPPSSKLPDEETLQDLLSRAQQRKPDTTLDDIRDSFGHYYRLMIADVKETLGNLVLHFPEYKAEGYEIAGFAWFQGWNDMINSDYTAAYADNMANFIRDVRRDLDAPAMPFVIGQLGVGGVDEAGPNTKRDAFKAAQAAAAELPEFQGNVALVKTDQFWDMDADRVFKKGWRENLDEWNTVGSDRPYHYLGSPTTYSQIGKALATALLELGSSQTTFYDPIERDLEGWKLAVDPQLLAEENQETAEQAFTALANHLQRVKYIVTEDRVQQLQQLPIWLELHNAELGAMQYHPDRGWLLAHGHDPRLVKHVHIPRASALFDPGMWAKHPYVVLHELAHSYHDQILSFDHPEIIAAFEEAKANGIYDQVLLFTGKKVRHYALSNHKEYFAESTEAYFGVNDFYPFVRAELKEHDPRMFELMQKHWGGLR